MLYSAYFMLTA